MVPRLVPLALLTALTLAGCGGRGGGSVGSVGGLGGGTGFVDLHADVTTRMFVIAQRFELDRNQGGMSQVALDIDRCYAEAMHYGEAQIFALRDCLVLD